MGKWNHRPRRRTRYYDSSDFYPPHHYITLTPDDWKRSNAPLWERQFCQQVCSVPWKNVLLAKKYMHCYDNVVKWNDSESEEAFTKAKIRFRAGIDGLPCDLPLPDPNMYIGEIDWNPEIDPELIVDLEKEYFNPDKGEIVQKIESREHISESCNPWERCVLEATEAALKDVARVSSQWVGSVGEESNKRRNNANENPWEQSDTRVKGGTTNSNPWLGGNDNSWGWDRKGQVDDERRRPNNYNNQGGWQNVGSGNHNNYRGQNQLNNDRDWGWRQQPGQNNDINYIDDSRGRGVSGGGQWRKREGSHQYISRHKIPRFDHGDSNGSDRWTDRFNQNRDSAICPFCDIGKRGDV